MQQPAGDRVDVGVRLAVLVFALAGVVLTARLGFWQWDRAAQKEALQAMLDTRAGLPPVGAVELAAAPSPDGGDLLYRSVRLRGHWLAERTVYLENRQMSGRPGFFVVTPLQWPGGTVLVQRGWAARDNDDRARLPALAAPAGEVDVAGRIAPPPSRLYEFSAAASGPIRQNLDVESFSRETGLALLPLTVLQSDDLQTDGLLRHWPPPAVGIEKHYGYALQWWALSALITGLYAWYQVLRPRLGRSAR
jgi:surfeit locus 1 family protein